VWFVKIGEKNNEWFMVCMGDGVKNRFVVAHDETNEL
jgi:hypothetical protein